MSHYTISSPNIVTVHVCSKLETSWKSVVFTDKVGKHSRYFLGVFNKTIILLTLVGYEMIIANSYPMHTHGIIVKYTVEIKKDYSLGSIYSENSIVQIPEEQSQVHTYIHTTKSFDSWLLSSASTTTLAKWDTISFLKGATTNGICVAIVTIVRQSVRATAPKRKNSYYGHKVFDASNIDWI